MKPAYVDSSVLVKHYAHSQGEKGTPLASRIMGTHEVYVSSIAQIEVLSALSRKCKLGEASVEKIEEIKEDFLSDCEAMGIVELREDVIREAQKLVFRVQIKTLDAIHLASAIALKRITDIAFPFATSDKQLAVAAGKEGFEVIRVGI